MWSLRGKTEKSEEKDFMGFKKKFGYILRKKQDINIPSMWLGGIFVFLFLAVSGEGF